VLRILLSLVPAVGCAAVMFVCMRISMGGHGQSTGSQGDRTEEVAELREEVARLRAELAARREDAPASLPG